MANGPDELIALAGLGVIAFAILLSFGFTIIICVITQGCFNRIPEQYRRQTPGMVWLLLIPCFSIIWNFFVFPKLAESFKAYFDDQGPHNEGDAGGNLAMAYCVLNCCSFIPYIGCLAGLAALVILIIMLIKFVGLKDKIA